MKTLFFSLLCCLLNQTLWAGTELKAKVESTSHPNAWVDISAFVDQGRVRLRFDGPWTHGTLLYDSSSSAITIVDDINKIVLPIGSTAQAAFRMVEGLAGEGLKSQLNGAVSGVKMAYHLAEINSQALFDGDLILEQKNVMMDGFHCALYGTTVDGAKTREVWIVPAAQCGLSDEDYHTLQGLLDHLVDLLSPELKQLGANTELYLNRAASTQMPTHLCLYLNGKIATRYKLIGYQLRGSAPGDFDPPANYRVVGLMDLLHQ